MPVINSITFSLRRRVKETTQTSGVGAYSLDGVSEEGMQSFLSAVGGGGVTAYMAQRGSIWEEGLGTVTAGAPVTLSRDLILGTSSDPSIGADPIDWAGTDPKDIFIEAPEAMLNQIGRPGDILWGGVSSGNNAHAISVNSAITNYFDGLTVFWRRGDTDSTGNMTLNLNSMGAKSLLKSVGVEIPAGEAKADAIMGAIYLSALDDFVVITGLRPLGATKGDLQVYTSNDTWTKPPGLTFIEVEMVGGGGSGGSADSDNDASSGGGGGGEYGYARIPDSQLGASETVTVGTGGAAPSAGNNDGNAGAASSFGSLLTAAAGGGGEGAAEGASSTTNLGGAGGSGGSSSGLGTGTAYHIAGSPGDNGGSIDIGGEDRRTGNANGGRGGGPLGGGGGLAGVTGAGSAGGNYGGGGGGTGGGAAGGAGAGGVVIVHEFFS